MSWWEFVKDPAPLFSRAFLRFIWSFPSPIPTLIFPASCFYSSKILQNKICLNFRQYKYRITFPSILLLPCAFFLSVCVLFSECHTDWFKLMIMFAIYRITIIIILLMKTSMNLNDLMMSLAGKTEGKLGYTTTVKEQVDDIEVPPFLFRWQLIISRRVWNRREKHRVNFRSNWKSCKSTPKLSFSS